jgi:hypothetical protein
VTATPAGHQPDDISRQDLAALAECAQPRGLDHRVAEIVVVLSGYFARTQADAQSNRLYALAVVTLDALLHDHRARQGVRCRGEDRHQPIAKVLDLGPIRFREGPTQP